MPQRLKGSKTHEVSYQPISEHLEKIGKLIVNSDYTVHYNLGPGLLEKVYEVCLCHELSKRGLIFQRQVGLDIKSTLLSQKLKMVLDGM